MLRLCRNKKAQAAAEYAILIGLVVAVIIGMQTFAKRGFQGKLKDSTDMYVDDLEKSRLLELGAPGAGYSMVGNQFEDNDISSVSTQIKLKDTESVNLDQGLTGTRTQDRRTSSSYGDYQNTSYNATP